MKMTNKNAGDARRRYIGIDELTLCSFTRIEEEPFFIPAQEVGSMVAPS